MRAQFRGYEFAYFAAELATAKDLNLDRRRSRRADSETASAYQMSAAAIIHGSPPVVKDFAATVSRFAQVSIAYDRTL